VGPLGVRFELFEREHGLRYLLWEELLERLLELLWLLELLLGRLSLLLWRLWLLL
jgi:hypothetical protein